MKKNLFLLWALVPGMFFPVSAPAAVGYLYESDYATGTIFQFASTVPGAARVPFATGLSAVRGLAYDHAGNLFAGLNDRIVKIAPNGKVSILLRT